jgi:hypothetical protein
MIQEENEDEETPLGLVSDELKEEQKDEDGH